MGWREKEVEPVRDYTLQLLIFSLLLILIVGVVVYLLIRRKEQKLKKKIPVPKKVEGELLVPKNEYVKEVFRVYRKYASGLVERGYLPPNTRTVREEEEEARMKGIPLPRKKTDRFLDTFEKARYSDLPVGPEDVDNAQRLLAAIDSALHQSEDTRGGGKK